MDALDKPPDATAVSIQASLLAVTIEDVCRILFRQALLQCEGMLGSSTSKIEIAVDYEMWTVSVTFELDRSSDRALSTEVTRHSIDDEELRSMSYLGLVQLTVSSSIGTSEYIWQDGHRNHSQSSSEPFGDPSSSFAAAWTRGVRISMRNIFSGMPVRRKIVASESSERGAVPKLLYCVRELSLLVPGSSVRLIVRHTALVEGRAPTNKVLLSLPRGKDLVHRCHAAFGDASVLAETTRFVAEERTIGPIKMKIAGFAGSSASPEAAIRVIFLQASVWPGAMIRGALQQSERMSAVFASLLSGLGLPWTDEVDGRCGAQVELSPRMYDKVRQKIKARASHVDHPHASITFVLNVSLHSTHTDGHVETTSNTGSALTVESFEAALLDAIGGQPHAEHEGTSRKRKRSSRPSTAGDVGVEAEPTTLHRARPATASLAIESYGPAAAVPEGMVEWRHPVSGRVFHIDQRTGHSVAVGPRSTTNGDEGISASTKPRGLNGGVGVDRTKLKRSLSLLIPSRRRQAGHGEGDSTDEFDDPSLDAALAAMSSPSSVADSDSMKRSRFFDTCRSSLPVNTSASGPLHHDDSDVRSMPGRTDVVELAITRSDLQIAHVLNQVDGKFILCCTSSTSSKTNGVVFCIDQHAADERYRLERLLEQYVDDCAAGAAVYQLASTFTLPITVQQHDLIKGDPAVELNMKTLGWSIKAVVMIHSSLGHTQVDLDGIPSILRDKALTDRGKVKDQSLLQKCFASCLDSSHRLFEVKSGEDWSVAWTRIPGELLEVLKSTACRGAIMFNDVLERDACERVVNDSSKSRREPVKTWGCSVPSFDDKGRMGGRSEWTARNAQIEVDHQRGRSTAIPNLCVLYVDDGDARIGAGSLPGMVHQCS